MLLTAALLGTTAMADNEVKLYSSNSQTVNADNPTHRIPAIAAKGDTLVAICDERINTAGGDIGAGRIDITYRVSTDNGKTWSAAQKLIQGTGSGNTAAYGDAAVVCDRTTGKLLVMCAAGNVSYSSSNYTTSSNANAIRIAKITGTINSDGTVTWSAATDMTATIYGLFSGNVTKAFFGSGKLFQSSIVRNGTNANFRIYGALTTNKGSVVVYTDDLGTTWKVLGTATDTPASSGDEAKVTELANGDVLLCAKVLSSSGRIYNRFHYTSYSAGSWLDGTGSSSSITAARCNGEIVIVRGTNITTDHSNYDRDAYVALLSVPADNSSRKNVTIYWKAIDDRADCDAIDDFTTAGNWTAYQVSTTNSAYSTMVQDGNGDIAFFYEENNYAIGSGNERYDMMFKTIPLSTITGGKYSSKDPWEGRIILLKANIQTSSSATTSYYLHNNNVELVLSEASTVSDTDLDKSYYWVISKAPDGSHYYLSSYKGDGYIGKVYATDYSQSSGTVSRQNGVGCTSNYLNEFYFTNFVKNGVNLNKTSSAVTGYSLDFFDTGDGNKHKYVAVSNTGEVNWYNYTTTGASGNNSSMWSTDFDVIFVYQLAADAEQTFGTLTDPKEYGWPLKFVRHESKYTKLDYENDNFYATVKLPFAITMPENTTAYQVTGKANEFNQQVTLTKLELEDNVLPRETPVLLCMTKQDGEDDVYLKTVYLRPAYAHPILSTGFQGTLGAKTLSSTSTDADYYDPVNNHNIYYLSRKNGRVAFYYLSNRNIAANKAYYVFEDGNNANSLSFLFDDDEATSIAIPAVSDDSDAPTYDLMGRRVEKPTQLGIYIRAGRKFVVK